VAVATHRCWAVAWDSTSAMMLQEHHRSGERGGTELTHKCALQQLHLFTRARIDSTAYDLLIEYRQEWCM